MRSVSLLFLAGLVVCEALTGSLLFGGAATGFLYATGFALGPLGFGAVFLGSSYGAHYLGTKMEAEARQQRLSQTAIDRLFWTNCSRPATFTTAHICKSKRHCEDVIRIQGSHDCNACGANALVARRWINPLDTSDYSTEVVCMNAHSRQVFSTPFHSTPAGFWNCSTLPHFHECRRCGENTAFARYDSHITAAGLQLICVRTDATIDQKFV